jgi:hypothetical protein
MNEPNMACVLPDVFAIAAPVLAKVRKPFCRFSGVARLHCDGGTTSGIETTFASELMNTTGSTFGSPISWRLCRSSLRRCLVLGNVLNVRKNGPGAPLVTVELADAEVLVGDTRVG